MRGPLPKEGPSPCCHLTPLIFLFNSILTHLMKHVYVQVLNLSNSLWPHGLQPTRLLCPWNFPGKILERVAISYTRVSSQPRDRTHVSCIGRWIFYQESPLRSPIWWPLRRSFSPQTTWENSPGICVTSRVQDRFSREQDDLRGCVGWWVLKALLQSVHLIQRSTCHHQQDWTGRRAWPGVWKARIAGQEERVSRRGENSRMQNLGLWAEASESESCSVMSDS